MVWKIWTHMDECMNVQCYEHIYMDEYMNEWYNYLDVKHDNLVYLPRL